MYRFRLYTHRYRNPFRSGIAGPGTSTAFPARIVRCQTRKDAHIHAHILGVVMNGYNAKKTGRKDGYSYAYSYGYYDNRDTGDK